MLLAGCLNQEKANPNTKLSNENQVKNPINSVNPINNTETNTKTQPEVIQTKEPDEIKTFTLKEGEICLEDGKPVIRLFSTTWCPHCVWIKETFYSTVKKFVDSGKIIAHHWELDTGDDTLTEIVETEVPESELVIYKEFNPRGSIPTFVFGCKYFRVGNGFESTKDLDSEKKEFKAVIESLLQEA